VFCFFGLYQDLNSYGTAAASTAAAAASTASSEQKSLASVQSEERNQ